jgi:hypothetical protein
MRPREQGNGRSHDFLRAEIPRTSDWPGIETGRSEDVDAHHHDDVRTCGSAQILGNLWSLRKVRHFVEPSGPLKRTVSSSRAERAEDSQEIYVTQTELPSRASDTRQSVARFRGRPQL